MAKQSRGGTKKTSAPKIEKPAYLKETEKAVQLKMKVENWILEKERTVYEWVPKSQLTDAGVPSRWITEKKMEDQLNGTQFVAWVDANGKEFSFGLTERDRQSIQARQSRRERAMESYEALVQQAKDMGVPGIRRRMKAKTIRQKMWEFENSKGK